MGKKDEFSQEEADAAGQDRDEMNRDRAAQEKALGNPHDDD